MKNTAFSKHFFNVTPYFLLHILTVLVETFSEPIIKLLLRPSLRILYFMENSGFWRAKENIAAALAFSLFLAGHAC